jgi:hypothetical protein
MTRQEFPPGFHDSRSAGKGVEKVMDLIYPELNMTESERRPWALMR